MAKLCCLTRRRIKTRADVTVDDELMTCAFKTSEMSLLLSHLHHLCTQWDADEQVARLLACRVNVNLRDVLTLKTPLHVAVHSLNESLVRLLLEAAADPLLTDASGRPPLLMLSDNVTSARRRRAAITQ